MERDKAPTNDNPDYYGGINTMKQIDAALGYLLQSIKESNEYHRYLKAKEELHLQPELEQKVDDFRKMNYQIQNSGNLNLFDEVDRIDRESGVFLRNPIVEEYLAAELAFCRLVQKINWTIIEELDFEVEFMN